jgi:dCMP deaminase
MKNLKVPGSTTKLTTNPNRIELDEAYMQMAEIWARRSKANRSQVGCLIIKDSQIISDGFNGMPSGSDDDVCEYLVPQSAGWDARDEDIKYELRTKPEVLHAESNALMKISEHGGLGAHGATLYTTLSPCFDCAKLIKQAKIKRVVFRKCYRDMSGVDLLRKLGVQVDQL